MNTNPYSQLVRYQHWASRGLYEVVDHHIDRLNAEDAANIMRILDHIFVVERVFQHHLQGLPHGFQAARSDVMPDLQRLAKDAMEVDGWYVSYVDTLSAQAAGETVDFAYINGTPARMTRGEMLLHVCLHGTYHRGNAGVLLLKNNIMPNQDRMTDFLEAVA
ncbi:DinB family protein [Paraburkholderia sp. BL21I4N1]|uniref:DinB family protein n=1 Tax=Paraburkholderia sp. BL21I4N1 TaxID=1938801 RepID=UPI000CFD28A8|nr:DinB family protein [Paraburkholderia sp. BL21I4N1]PQV50129.1 putative damage-inducible protein DinB [Paraburkholderia sp. BL21I4N1]